MAQLIDVAHATKPYPTFPAPASEYGYLWAIDAVKKEPPHQKDIALADWIDIAIAVVDQYH